MLGTGARDYHSTSGSGTAARGAPTIMWRRRTERPGLDREGSSWRARSRDRPVVKRILAIILTASLAISCAGRRAAGQLRPGDQAIRLTPAWSLDLDIGASMQLLSAPGGFVLVSSSGRVVLVNASEGTVSWKAESSGDITGAAAVLAADASGRGPWLALPRAGGVVTLSLSDGREAWSWRARGDERLHLSGVGTGLLVLTSGARALLLNSSSGSEIWNLELPSPASAPGTRCREQILAGLEDGYLVGLASDRPEILWRKKLRSPAAVAPGCTGRHVFVATADDAVHALRLHRRSAGRMWKIKTGADPAASPQAIENMVLLLSKDTYLYGVRRRNGHLVFRIRLNRRPGPTALLDDLVLVSGMQATRLDSFRLPLGINAGGFDLPVGTRFVTPPVVSGDLVALGVARFGEEDRSRLVALKRSAVPAAGQSRPASE